MSAQEKPRFGKQPKAAKKGSIARTYKDPKLDENPIDWTKNRVEYLMGAGISGFLGDLGGQNGVGQPFIFDLEPMDTRYSVSAGVRYFLREYHAVRGTISYARVRGSDASTEYPNRKYRNLNFKSPIIELAGSYEFYILKPKTIHLMGARTSQIFDGNRLSIYGSVGAGFFFFNPKAEYGGNWYALKPLNTAGQGFPNGPKNYHRMSIAFPLGGGVSYLLNHNSKIGLDFGYRYTLSDNIDDANGYYYDNAAIAAKNGKLAGLLANPSVLLPDVPNRDWYLKNQPRGGEGNDSYMFLQVTFAHSFTPSVSNRDFKQKKGKQTRSYNDKKSLKNREKGQKIRSYNNKKIKNKKKKFKSPNLDFGRKKRQKNKIKTF